MAGPGQVFSLAEHISDEMQERGWKTGDVALRMANGREYGMNLFCLELVMCVEDDSLLIDDETFDGLAKAFGVSDALFRSLHEQWSKWPDRRSSFQVADDMLTGCITWPVH